MRAAIYARYSTEKQSEHSIEDQCRVCERLAERYGFQIVAHFSDSAVSGGTAYRDGYQRLLAAARTGEFEVIVAEDTSRLWRLMAEQAPRLAELRDLGVHVVTHDLDTRQDNAAILGAVNGAMSEHYRQEIARRTRRGLEGRARAKQPTGGRAYGYIAARDSSTGQRAVDVQQAEVVRRVFQLYADGVNPREIAGFLNEERVPSPGSSWGRNRKRSSKWMHSAIAGDPSRGIGILNNELYIGRVIWNRFRWVRSAADSKRRRYVLNPEREWVVHTDESLRIIPQDLWERVKARQRARSETIGETVRQGLRRAIKRAGRKPAFLFSGLLTCGCCGANFVMTSRTHYSCASRTHGGKAACDSAIRLKRTVIEAGLLNGIKEELLAPDIIAEVGRQVREIVRRAMRASQSASDASDRRAALEREIQNLTDAVASGALKGSMALADRLMRAEADLARLQTAPKPPAAANIERRLPEVADRYRALVVRLETSLAEADVDMARAELRRLFGSIRVDGDQREVRLEADLGAVQASLVKAAGGSANNVVAGAGFEPATFGL